MKHIGKAGKPRNKPPDLNGKTQFQRFVETVKALEVDESGEAFEKALNVVVLVKPAVIQPRPSGKRSSSSRL